MFKHLRPVWAEINLDNLAFNMQQIKKISKSKDIIGVVKADAYGHGALDVAPVLLENGATSLAVAMVSEGVELRRSGIESPILILGFTAPSLIPELLKYDIEQTVFSYEYAKELSEIAKEKHKIAKIHIALDTGMGRIGFLPNQSSIEEICKINKLSNISIAGMFSHFSTADEKNKEYTQYQFEKFNDFYNSLKKKGVDISFRHIANSAAIIDLKETHLEAVRPGIILYGYYPSKDIDKSKLELRPVMRVKTKIVHIKTMESGQYISYGRRFKSCDKCIIATLPVGYADGYSRLLFNKGKVILHGEYAPVVGNICMDQCMIDVTNIHSKLEVGDEVVLMGEDNGIKFDANDIAELLGTINYEVICSVSKRIPRVYIKDGEVVKIRNYV